MIQSKILDKLLNLEQKIVIAIDGTAGSGKGTLAKLLAERFGLIHCQTSLFYRGLALEVLKRSKDMSIDDIISLAEHPLYIVSSPDLYTPEVTEMTSIISAIPEVRESLKKPQQDFLLHNNRVVMEGRDIGTVIAPDADLKLFITADLETRAQRRFNQMNGSVSLEKIQKDIEMRDLRDTSRSSAPLAKAHDAIEISTTSKSPEKIVEWILNNH